MVKRAQRGYYRMSAPRRTLGARIDALTNAIPPGSHILDIGGNNGAISKGLIAAGAAETSIVMDLENILKDPPPQVSFEQIDISTCDMDCLPRREVVLILNLLHHVCRSPIRARHVLSKLLEHSEHVYVDMGSCNERPGNRRWQKAIRRHWKRQSRALDDLHKPARGLRQRILSYRQHGAYRILWHLSQYHQAIYGDFEILQRYRRPVATRPRNKGLVPVANWEDRPRPFGRRPGNLAPYARFWLVKDRPTGVLYFAKKYDGETLLDMAREWALYDALKAEFGPWLVSPVAYHPALGMLYLYDYEVMHRQVCHYRDHRRFFTGSTSRAIIQKLGNTVVDLPLTKTGKVKWLTDVQIVNTDTGLRFLDLNIYRRRRLAGSDPELLSKMKII